MTAVATRCSSTVAAIDATTSMFKRFHIVHASSLVRPSIVSIRSSAVAFVAVFAAPGDAIDSLETAASMGAITACTSASAGVVGCAAISYHLLRVYLLSSDVATASFTTATASAYTLTCISLTSATSSYVSHH